LARLLPLHGSLLRTHACKHFDVLILPALKLGITM